MKKVITALGNPTLNEEILKNKEYEVLAPDIQYQEGIIGFLEKNNRIDFLILNSLLPGEVEIKKFIEDIKKINSTIEIIIILEKENEELKNFLISKKILNIFYNNQITTQELIKVIQNNFNENK